MGRTVLFHSRGQFGDSVFQSHHPHRRSIKIPSLNNDSGGYLIVEPIPVAIQNVYRCWNKEIIDLDPDDKQYILDVKAARERAIFAGPRPTPTPEPCHPSSVTWKHDRNESNDSESSDTGPALKKPALTRPTNQTSTGKPSVGDATVAEDGWAHGAGGVVDISAPWDEDDGWSSEDEEQYIPVVGTRYLPVDLYEDVDVDEESGDSLWLATIFAGAGRGIMGI
ncbi:uncharacterized protein EV422DRAFT_563313 [Fimicolochytrium jonesii]|uniref:uncharacterized protein n=1 Tax=Fimicolochytrium jonesii TaxID=1396493 RepID=UPI0022FDB839|nr:uncharacterized protein EV422DRAFT_563313 [Fimicolochytrium jonesii]KAI8827229.1 hypothetical protein EV422DRAFT_563313 [Fimicolochytrium jonesii]